MSIGIIYLFFLSETISYTNSCLLQICIIYVNSSSDTLNHRRVLFQPLYIFYIYLYIYVYFFIFSRLFSRNIIIDFNLGVKIFFNSFLNSITRTYFLANRTYCRITVIKQMQRYLPFRCNSSELVDNYFHEYIRSLLPCLHPKSHIYNILMPTKICFFILYILLSQNRSVTALLGPLLSVSCFTSFNTPRYPSTPQ